MTAFQADTVYTPVMPSFRGYLGAVQRGTRQPSQQAGDQAGEAFAKAFGQKAVNGAQGVEQLQKRIARSVSTASGQVKDAREREEAATRQLNIQELRLQELRSSGKGTASQLATAEDRVAKAQRAVRLASNQTAGATQKLAAVQEAGNRELRSAEQAATRAGGRFRALAADVRAAGKVTAETATSEEGFGSFKPAAAVGIAALVGLGSAAVGAGIKTAAGMETARIGFTTMLGSAQKADDFLRQLQQFAATTPFEFPELQEAASSLISVGVDADKIIPIMRTLGDTTAGMGTGAEGIQRATVALQQMSAAGKITGEDLNQLRDAGIPVFDLLAAATGKSKSEVVALAQAGKLGKTELDQLFNALETGKGLERFNGLMEKTSTTLTGLASTLSDTFSQGMAQAIEPAIPLIKDELGGAIAFVNQEIPVISSGIRDLATGIGNLTPLIGGLGTVAGVGLKLFSGLSSVVGGTFLGSTNSATAGVAALIAVMGARKLSGFGDQLVDLGSKLEGFNGRLGRVGGRIGTFGAGLGRVTSFLGGPWGIAIGLGVTALTSFIGGQQDASKEAKEFTDTLTFQKGALDENSRSLLANKLAKDGVFDAAQKAGIGEQDFFNALTAGGSARTEMIAQLDGIAHAHTRYQTVGYQTTLVTDDTAKAATTAANALRAQGGALDETAHSQLQANTAVTKGVTAQQQLDSATKDLKAAQGSLRTETQKLANSFTILKNGALDQATADSAWQAALDEATDSVKQNGRSLSETSAKGRANRATVLDMVRALNDKVTSDFKATSSSKGLKVATDQASAATKSGRKSILDSAAAAGLNRDQVAKMIDKMIKTPKELKTDVNTPGMKTAQDNVDSLGRKIRDIKDRNPQIDVGINFSTNKLATSIVSKYGKTAKIPGLAAGGPVPNYSGLGRQSYDTESAMLRVDEHVWTPEEVDAAGGHGAMYRMRAMARKGMLHFRDGGAVNRHINVRALANFPSYSLAGLSDAAAQAGTSTGTLFARQMAKSFTDALNAQLDSGGGLVAGGNFAKALSFARSQAGKPYVWAAAGPGGYDCSGFMGSIQNVIDGENPYHRRWSTGAFGGQKQALGFTRNAKSAFMIGITNAGVGHTAGTLNGVNVESRGGAGVIVGSRARGYNDRLFTSHWGLTKGIGAKALGGSAAIEAATGSPRAIGRKLLAVQGFGPSQYPYLDKLWTRESNWRVSARNPSSGAFGIPQALPGSKMASAGADWRTSAKTQETWGLDYIRQRYGSPQNAWRHEVSHGWYDMGGDLPPGLTVAFNGTGKTEHVFTDRQMSALLSKPKDQGGPGRQTHFHGDVYTVSAEKFFREQHAAERLEDALHPTW